MPTPSKLVQLPGSEGEHALQRERGTAERAEKFYSEQMLDHLNESMIDFICNLDMMFVSTADARGHCDCSIRCGLTGFVRVLKPRRLIYPEYRGNGVLASLGNIRENPHVGLLLVDFFQDCVGLHINGRAAILNNDQLAEIDPSQSNNSTTRGRRPECWVSIDIDEAYVHCSKHIPLLSKLPKKIHWGTDDPTKKGGNYFKIEPERP